MAKAKRKTFEPLAWQFDPLRLKTDKVQFWQKGLMMGLVDLSVARELVAEKQAYVMCDQAIAFYNGGN